MFSHIISSHTPFLVLAIDQIQKSDNPVDDHQYEDYWESISQILKLLGGEGISICESEDYHGEDGGNNEQKVLYYAGKQIEIGVIYFEKNSDSGVNEVVENEEDRSDDGIIDE